MYTIKIVAMNNVEQTVLLLQIRDRRIQPSLLRRSTFSPLRLILRDWSLLNLMQLPRQLLLCPLIDSRQFSFQCTNFTLAGSESSFTCLFVATDYMFTFAPVIVDEVLNCGLLRDEMTDEMLGLGLVLCSVKC